MGNELKKCIECGELIDRSASLCKNCGSYQSRRKNRLKYYANIVALFSFVGAALSLPLALSDDIRKFLFWNDKVEIFSLSFRNPTVLANTGDGAIYVSHVSVHAIRPDGKPADIPVPIERSISPGKELSKDINHDLKEKIKAWEKSASDSGHSLVVVEAESMEERQAKLRKMVTMTDDGCVFFDFSVDHDPHFQTYREHLGDNLVTLEVDIKIEFYSFTKRKWITQELDGVGFLWEFDGVECESKS